LKYLIAILVLMGSPAWAAPSLTSGQVAKLNRGKIIMRSLKPTGNEGVAVRAHGVVKAPMDKVWPVVRDCQHFAKFMPRTKRSELQSRTGNVSKCFFEIDMPFPFSDLWSVVNSVESRTTAGGYKRSWTLIRGTYHRNNGSWTASPWGPNGKETLLSYQIDLNPNVSLPDFIIRKAQSSTMPDVFEAVRKRVAALP